VETTTLVEIGKRDGETLLPSLLARSEAPSLAHFVRSLVGLDRAAAQAAFSGFLNDRSLTPPQIRFVEMVIEGIFKTLEAVRSGSIADVG
jgi:type I restriction enzyme R subunit